MVDVGIDVVDTDSVDTEHLHESGVAKAVVLVRQRVLANVRVVARATARLVGDTDDLVAVTTVIVDEVLAIDSDDRHGSGQVGSAEEAQKDLDDLS